MSAPANATGIGRSVRRREDPRLLSGKGRYSDDLNLAGQAYAIMVRSPHAHARLGAIDTAAARAVPGVLAVLTGADMLADGLHPIPHAVWSRHPAELYLPNSDGSQAFIPPHHCMATEEVRHVGEIVAVVVATDRRGGEGCSGTGAGGVRTAAGRHRVRWSPWRPTHRMCVATAATSASIPWSAIRRRPKPLSLAPRMSPR